MTHRTGPRDHIVSPLHADLCLLLVKHCTPRPDGEPGATIMEVRYVLRDMEDMMIKRLHDLVPEDQCPTCPRDTNT